MKKLIIDGSKIESKDSLHTKFQRVLNFPDYYGKNLDALHDCLTDINEEVMIYINNLPALCEILDDYADSLLSVLKQSAEENKYLHVTIND